MENNRIKIRVLYQKLGRAKYISHLDINRLMQRVLKRAGLPVWYTEGFNPHMYLNFALPLSLGYESEAEYMDFWLTRELPADLVCQLLNENMPEGITVLAVYPPEHKPAEIGAADFLLRMKAKLPPQELLEAFATFYASEQIEVVKKTKRGEKTVDIKPDLMLLDSKVEGEYVILNIRFPAGNEKNYNPSLLLEAFTAQTGITPSCAVVRRQVYCKDGSAFR